MPISLYVAGLRSKIGQDLLMLPAVTAVITRGPRFLLARHRDSELWNLIGGGMEPGEEPSSAVVREVREELGVTPQVGRIVGAYGGPPLEAIYPNGDRVSYVTVAYTLPNVDVTLDADELIEAAWFSASQAKKLPRHDWIDRVIDDCSHARWHSDRRFSETATVNPAATVRSRTGLRAASKHLPAARPRIERRYIPIPRPVFGDPTTGPVAIAAKSRARAARRISA